MKFLLEIELGLCKKKRTVELEEVSKSYNEQQQEEDLLVQLEEFLHDSVETSYKKI